MTDADKMATVTRDMLAAVVLLKPYFTDVHILVNEDTKSVLAVVFANADFRELFDPKPNSGLKPIQEDIGHA